MEQIQQTDVRLKLLIDTKEQRVLYGETDKKFIDFLFNLLSLPLGAVISLLKKDGMVGCLGNLYESIETLNEAYLQSSQSKDIVLKPPVIFNCLTKLLPNVKPPQPAAPTFYVCDSTGFNSSSGFNLNSSSGFNSSSSCRSYVSDGPDARCQSCNNYMRRNGKYVCPPGKLRAIDEKGGFVKDLATYIVMDDLTVKHISDFSITTLLKKFSIKDVDSLEEKLITLDVHEGVELLEASLQSKTVLTNAFLKRRRSHIDINDVKVSEDVKPSNLSN